LFHLLVRQLVLVLALMLALLLLLAAQAHPPLPNLRWI
jgi:hypothetical protein